jgi:hypothetical protein
MSSWYKKAKTVMEMQEEYAKVINNAGGVSISGSGAGKTFNVAGKSFSARTILDKIVSENGSYFKGKGIKEINTDPIGASNVQGLAKSDSPGKIQVDVSKIVDGILKQFQNAVPPNIQSGGTSVDNDYLNDIAKLIFEAIQGEVANTVGHESGHMGDFAGAISKGVTNLSGVSPESGAEAEGGAFSKRYLPDLNSFKSKVTFH